MNSSTTFHVYMMSNKNGSVLYIGSTSDIEARVVEHKSKVNPKSFTAKYNCDKLVYFEEHNSRIDAEKRESQLKKWKREWKIELIEKLNPEWMDIAMNWSNDNHIILKSKRIKAAIDYYKDISNLDL